MCEEISERKEMGGRLEMEMEWVFGPISWPSVRTENIASTYRA